MISDAHVATVKTQLFTGIYIGFACGTSMPGRPQTLHVNTNPYKLNPKSQTLNLIPKTFNHKIQSLNHQAGPLNPLP